MLAIKNSCNFIIILKINIYVIVVINSTVVKTHSTRKIIEKNKHVLALDRNLYKVPI